MQAVKVRVLSRLPKYFMKVTVENKKGLNKDLKVLIDKKTISEYLDAKYEEIVFLSIKTFKSLFKPFLFSIVTFIIIFGRRERTRTFTSCDMSS